AGIEELVDRFVGLRERAGAANAGRTVITLLYAIAPGADSNDDGDVRRSERGQRSREVRGPLCCRERGLRCGPPCAAARESIDLVE
ncbi:MAG: hypothetical protein ACXVFD_16650, partial [Gaiellaceae bacterium]